MALFEREQEEVREAKDDAADMERDHANQVEDLGRRIERLEEEVQNEKDDREIEIGKAIVDIKKKYHEEREGRLVAEAKLQILNQTKP